MGSYVKFMFKVELRVPFDGRYFNDPWTPGRGNLDEEVQY